MSDTPSFTGAIKMLISKAVLALHTAMPGEVLSYDAATQTADVRPLLRWQAFLPGQVRSMVDLPILPDVLVCHPRAGSVGMHLPLAAGDLVLLVFCSRSLTSWRSQGSAANVTDPGRALTPTPLDGAVALPLMTHDSNAWTGLNAGSTLNIGDDGGSLDFVALAQKVDTAISNVQSVLDSHTHLAGTLVAPSGGGPVTGVSGAPVTTAGSQSSTAASDVKAT